MSAKLFGIFSHILEKAHELESVKNFLTISLPLDPKYFDFLTLFVLGVEKKRVSVFAGIESWETFFFLKKGLVLDLEGLEVLGDLPVERLRDDTGGREERT